MGRRKNPQPVGEIHLAELARPPEPSAELVEPDPISLGSTSTVQGRLVSVRRAPPPKGAPLGSMVRSVASASLRSPGRQKAQRE